MATTENITEALDLMETSLPAQLKDDMNAKNGFNFFMSNADKFYKVIFASISNFLKYKQSKDAGSVALKINDMKGNFMMGATCNYIAGEEETSDDEENKGSWSLDYTFYEDDLKDVSQVYDIATNEYNQIVNDNMFKMAHGRFTDPKYISKTTIQIIDTLKNFLDNNCHEDGSVFSITVPDYFIASVGIEDGEKVFGIVPGSITKQLVKDDSIL